jgi:hypothetical protein
VKFEFAQRFQLSHRSGLYSIGWRQESNMLQWIRILILITCTQVDEIKKRCIDNESYKFLRGHHVKINTRVRAACLQKVSEMIRVWINKLIWLTCHARVAPLFLCCEHPHSKFYFSIALACFLFLLQLWTWGFWRVLKKTLAKLALRSLWATWCC